MTVEEIRELLITINQFGELLVFGKSDTSRTNKRLQSIIRLCEALAPFSQLDVDKFTDFLLRCKQYEETGLLAPKTSRKKTATPPPEEEVGTWVDKLTALRESITATTVSYQEIDEACHALEKLPKNTVVEIVRRLGLPCGSRDSRTTLANKVRQQLRERKATLERTAF